MIVGFIEEESKYSVNSWLAISLQFCLTVLRKSCIVLENYVCKVDCHFS